MNESMAKRYNYGIYNRGGCMAGESLVKFSGSIIECPRRKVRVLGEKLGH